jgi:Bardet-Biedl syndrome 9 protein
VPVFILISKDDAKVRVQSPDFSATWFVIQAII